MDELDELNECFSVIFHNVKECYSPRNIINCQFTVKEYSTFSKSKCHIAILLVAWDSLDSAVLRNNFENAVLESQTGIFTIEFDPRRSQFQEDEFYQFCFFDGNTSDVLGASCPFQVCKSFDDDGMGSMIHIDLEDAANQAQSVVENTRTAQNEMESLAAYHTEIDQVPEPSNSPSCVDKFQSKEVVDSWWLKGNDKPTEEDFDDTVLVHTRTTLMENALANAAKEREKLLNESKLKYESDLKQCSHEKEEIVKKTEAEIKLLKQRNKSLVESESLLKQNLLVAQCDAKKIEKLAADNAKNSELLILKLSAEKECLTKNLSERESEYQQCVLKVKTELNGQIDASETRCSQLNALLIGEKEMVQKMEYQYEETISSMRSEIEQLSIKENESANETSKSILELQTKLNAEIAQKHEYFNEIYKLKQAVESLSEQIKLKDKLIAAEREKVNNFSLQQDEITSRLGLESEKLRTEIDTLKANELSLVEAHSNELSCLRNRIAEIEGVAKEEKIKYKNDVELLSNELNDQVNCMNLLEAKMRENENQVAETHKQEKLELNDAIDELKAKLSEFEHQNMQITEEASKISLCQSCESGSKHALHVAIAHMQKQLNIYKKEKEKLCCTENSNNSSDVLKQNEEFRLRLCMGKRAFDKQYLECQKMRNELSRLKKTMEANLPGTESEQDKTAGQEEYNSLLLQYNNLKADNSKRVDELYAEVQRNDEQRQANEKDMKNIMEEKTNAIKLNEELRGKLIQLVDHYEGKLNLLGEENSMLKNQVDSLLQGGASLYNVGSNPDILPPDHNIYRDQPNLIQGDHSNKQHQAETNSRELKDVVLHQPNGSDNAKATVIVERQPTLLSDVQYPFDMLQGNGIIPRHGGSSEISGVKEIVIPTTVSNPLIRAEPPSQIISDRSTVELPPLPLSDQSICMSPQISHDLPTQKCPICSLDFPSNLSDSWKTNHVNNHFDHQ